ncbi:hypothetical protein ANAPC1_01204 [Anaplasma phagocytophilum]|uniref:Uncharacterized protein n=1 Tax=Anaplasma phagocytophilum TaxID=948 RepID=A0AA45ZI39_ANAPH|nr:hypothetical protein ANAPC1_01204 [Anaplasma phagocytophilum]SBO30571.1 hypothetical protein ANAPC4_00233 [Anaplasma phagocytophilum]SBO30910.1 hypothetical protein ANAPC2_00454 [Anaplasma phagocytophilum]SBO31426.1 hypothetical protein ANAPC3_00526 [Anaplasma phagocytophilum]SCV62184.1 hypothetical protein ANAPC5_00186 [Anaplasma phagocytophilum]
MMLLLDRLITLLLLLPRPPGKILFSLLRLLKFLILPLMGRFVMEVMLRER